MATAAKEEVSVNLKIFNDSYTIYCDPQEKEILLDVAEQLNTKFYEIHSKQPNLSREKVIVFCVLELVCKLRNDRSTTAKDIINANQISEKLNAALDMALAEIKPQ
ncbi:MAG: cell division protein ZapA [Cardiobacteriaceae bacterium]|nr:cell division protein ZapA [Cardiobacteriaceae bacterium]